MDTERVDLATFEACLKDLDRINRWTGAYRITLGWLERLREVHGLRRLVLVDIGQATATCCGGSPPGARRAAWLSICWGVDLNPYATALAAQATPPECAVRTECAIRYLSQPMSSSCRPRCAPTP